MKKIDLSLLLFALLTATNSAMGMGTKKLGPPIKKTKDLLFNISKRTIISPKFFNKFRPLLKKSFIQNVQKAINESNKNKKAESLYPKHMPISILLAFATAKGAGKEDLSRLMLSLNKTTPVLQEGAENKLLEEDFLQDVYTPKF